MGLTRARCLLAVGGLVASGVMAGTVLAAAPASAGSASAGSASAGSASAGSASAGSASAGPAMTTQVALINYCGDHGRVRPASEDLPGCMPSSEYLSKLTWASWRSVAYGSGVFRVNDCTPTCAQGTYVSYPILTVLWRAEPWPGHTGHSYFSRLTVIFTGSHHPSGPTAQTLA